MCTYRSVQKMPCGCRFGHAETWTSKRPPGAETGIVAMSRGADEALAWTVFRTLKNYSGIYFGFCIIISFGNINFFNVFYVICFINKSLSVFHISFYFKFSKWNITIFYYVYRTTNHFLAALRTPIKVWTLAKNCDNPLTKVWTLVQTKESPGGRKARKVMKNE